MKLRSHSRKILFAVVGSLLIVLGLILLLIPGPGLLLIIAGLVVLAQDFELPRKYLERLKSRLRL